MAGAKVTERVYSRTTTSTWTDPDDGALSYDFQDAAGARQTAATAINGEKQSEITATTDADGKVQPGRCRPTSATRR